MCMKITIDTKFDSDYEINEAISLLTNILKNKTQKLKNNTQKLEEDEKELPQSAFSMFDENIKETKKEEFNDKIEFIY